MIKLRIKEIKESLKEFYREDEIFSAKQLLIEAIVQTDKALNIAAFTKKRSGNHKCKSSVDDIMNMVKLVDEHLCLDKLPTFCAVKRSRVPVIVEELSGIAAVRMELNQLRQHVEDLTKQMSSILHYNVLILSNLLRKLLCMALLTQLTMK